jgi:ferredoxin--NADP+ reductase
MTLNAVLVSRMDVSPSVARFLIRPDITGGTVEPGQYLSIGLLVDGHLLQRPYSTATPAGVHPELEFLIRLVPGGAFTPRLWAMDVGDRVFLGRPKGRFTRIPDDRRTHLFIATGTGLAPFVAMLETMRADPPGRRRDVVVHGVAHVGELAYRDRLERWAAAGHLRYEPAISRPTAPGNAGWTGRTGRIDAILDEVCTLHDLAPADTVAYLCGNPDMIVAGTRILTARGIPDDAIRSEHYWPGS